MPPSKKGDLEGIDAFDVSFTNLVIQHYPKLSLPNYQRSFVWDKLKITTFLKDLTKNDEAPGIPNMFAGSVLMLRENHESIDFQKLTPQKLSNMDLDKLNKMVKDGLHLPKKRTIKSAITAIEKARPSSKIIDGQQRITTCFILAIILRGKISEHTGTKQLKQRLDGLLQTEDKKIRLELIGKDNDDLKAIFSKHKPAKPLPFDKKDPVWSQRGAGNAKNPICDAYRHINNWIDEQLELMTSKAKKKQWLKRYIEYLLDKLGFILIRVTKKGQGHLVFKSLNSTGEKLTQGELIKSMLFYLDLQRTGLGIESKWESLVANLEYVRFGSKDIVTDFWSVYAKSRDLIKSNTNLAKVIEDKFSSLDDDDLSEELKKMVSESEMYKQIILPPGSTKWTGVSRKNDLIDLRNNSFTQVRPLLLSARAVCGDARFDEIIKIVMSVVARIFIPTNTNPNVLSNEWRRWAKELRDNGESHVTQLGKEVHEWMLKHYGAKTQQEIDEAFCSSLINRELTNDQAKHYLRVIGTLDGNPYSDYAKAEIQAEHVFPKGAKKFVGKKRKIGKWWKDNKWKDPHHSRLLIGNFVLLEADINNFIKTKTWKEGRGKSVKKPTKEKDYGKYHGMRYYSFKVGTTKHEGSQFESTKKFYRRYSKNTKWTEQLIINRTKKLAERISVHTHWKI